MRKPPTKSAVRSTAGVRCAIYTRKSSEEGLEQEFNSLDAQREACEAYIRSQKAEGWIPLPTMYDDGGLSGATLERPALQRLLADIAAGKVDTVVVYKVDRLTRSLAGFAKIVEVFDQHQVSFVSITQSFNTTSSMGRLTLNMLLSFAQFEREVTGERIRDKIAASKQKGLWMGGFVPLGYDVQARKLVVNEPEAETVRHIYRRYALLGCVRALQAELQAAGMVSKRRQDRFGRESGGQPLTRGALYLILQNRIYRGEIVHKGASYPGEHQAIVESELWNQVQARLSANRVARSPAGRMTEPSLLAGLLHDWSGERMTPTHASKKGRRYRYYVSQSLITGEKGRGAGQRVPAGDLESLVQERVLACLHDATAVFEAVKPIARDIDESHRIVQRASALASRWGRVEPSTRRMILRGLVARVDLGREMVTLTIRCSALLIVGGAATGPECSHQNLDERGEHIIELTVPACLKRTGRETRLLIEGGERREPDRSLLRLLARAQRFRSLLLRGDGRSMAELAGEAGVSPSYFTRILKLSFLAPDIVQAILWARHPVALTAQRLTLRTDLPNAWSEQQTLLGAT